MTAPTTMRVRVVAQDPSLTDENGDIVTGLVTFPFEDVEAGPIGHRVHVVDYDSSTSTVYPPAHLDPARMVGRVSKRTILTTPDSRAVSRVRLCGRGSWLLGQRPYRKV